MHIKIIFKHIFLFFLAIPLFLGCFSCNSSDEEMRTPEDVKGVWKQGDNTYMELSNNNEVHKLVVYQQDNETIGRWTLDVYFYEPGYNLMIYINEESKANVYQIVSLTDRVLTWCWVDEIPVESIDRESIGQIIGEIINKAQEGYHLNPELFETFYNIPFSEFLDYLESLDIIYPWGMY